MLQVDEYVSRAVRTTVFVWPPDADGPSCDETVRAWSRGERGLIEPTDVRSAPGNMLLTAGGTMLSHAFIGGTFTPFSAANARLHIGDGGGSVPSDDPANQTHLARTGLVATTNVANKPMQSGWPAESISNGVARTDFYAMWGPGEAAWTWREVALANTATLSAGTPEWNHVGTDFGGALNTSVSRGLLMQIWWQPYSAGP